MAIPFNPAEIAIAINGTIEDEVLDAYGGFIRAVVIATPRKTGLAQGNWRTRLGAPAVGRIGRTSGSGAISSGLRTVRAAKRRLSKGRSGRIFITNNLPYIGRLNAGSSDLAPAFFVEISFQSAVKPRTPRRKNI